MQRVDVYQCECLPEDGLSLKAKGREAAKEMYDLILVEGQVTW